MRPQTIGRALGIGLRVAGRIAGQQLAGQGGAAGSRPAATATVSGTAHRAKGQAAGRATVHVGKGVSGFLRPFRRVGGILWLEVTGVFFLLFAMVFGWYMWQSWSAHVPHAWNRNAIVSGIFLLVFAYLGLSSFWRAGRR